MKISLDEHGILEISVSDENRYNWSNFQVMLNKAQLTELRDKINLELE